MRWQIVEEGKAKIRVPIGKLTVDLPVFYNPVMRMNRDITLHILSAWKKNKLKIADPLAGSGVRSIRIKAELPATKVQQLWINDANPTACRAIQENLRLSKLSLPKTPHEKVQRGTVLCNQEANQFLRQYRPFDYIDIDPFGSPNLFLDSAVQSVHRTGILAVTATDTSALAGSHPKACMRKYWASPLKNEFMHETGARILIRKVQLVGAQYERALLPLLTYASEHYTRIFFQNEKGKGIVDKILQQHSFLLWCRQCGAWKISQENVGECCSAMAVAGPLWTGKLWEATFLRDTKLQLSRATEDLLALLREEAQISQVGFYDLHKIGKRHHLPLRPMHAVQESLARQGFQSCRTHFSPTALRSSAPLFAVVKAMKQ